MVPQEFSGWLAPLSLSDRVRALALLYRSLTIGTRQFFLPGVADGKERNVVRVLQGINELHHTVANQVIAYSLENDDFAPDLFAQQLFDIASQYGIRELLAQAVDFVRSRNLWTGG